MAGPARVRRIDRRRRPFKREWPAKKVATVSVLAILGYSSGEIARTLKDGTSAASIRHQLARWGVLDQVKGDGKRRVAIRMPVHAIVKARDLAEEMGMDIEVWAGNIVEFAVKGGLYDAIVDNADGDPDAWK